MSPFCPSCSQSKRTTRLIFPPSCTCFIRISFPPPPVPAHQPINIKQAGIYSAHQMGSCRLSANPEDGPLRESGETWECDGLFVADASVFPTSLGINPMITVEAVAYMVADQVRTTPVPNP